MGFSSKYNVLRYQEHLEVGVGVVMGGDPCPKGPEFESRHRILDEQFFTYVFVVKFVMCLKRRK